MKTLSSNSFNYLHTKISWHPTVCAILDSMIFFYSLLTQRRLLQKNLNMQINEVQHVCTEQAVQRVIILKNRSGSCGDDSSGLMSDTG